MKKKTTEVKSQRLALRISINTLSKLQYLCGRNMSEYVVKLIETEYEKITGSKE
jgi:hypothetical protein